MNELFGEELLAVLQLAPFLRREHPRVTKAMHAQALRLPKLMRQEIRAFIDDEAPQKLPKPAPFDYLKTLEQVSRPVEQHDLENLVDAHQEPTDALDVMIPMSRALAYLSGAAPRRAKQTLTGAIQLVPSDQEVERFRRAFVVVDDPLYVLRKLRRLALMQDEVAALVAVYPALYGLLGDLVREELAAAKARKGAKWDLPTAQEKQLMMLLGMAPADADLVKDMQATYADEPQPGEAQPSGGGAARLDFKAGSFKTGAQASEGGGR